MGKKSEKKKACRIKKTPLRAPPMLKFVFIWKKQRPLHDDTRVARNTRPQVSSLLAHRSSNGRPLHLALGVDNDASVVLKVEENTIEALPRLGLANDDSRVDLFAQLRLALLDGRHDHVTNTTGGQAVEPRADTLDRNNVEVTRAGVVGAIHDRADCKTESHLELATRGTTGDLGHLVGCGGES